MHFISQKGFAYYIKRQKEYKNLERKEYWCWECDKNFDGTSEELVYHKDTDIIYHIRDLERGMLDQVFETRNEKTVMMAALVHSFRIPQLKKLIANENIKKHSHSSSTKKKIRERDENCCQLCGNDDLRVLEVHHLVPRANPFKNDMWKEDPINCITLCQNCHAIQHYILINGNDKERRDSFTKLALINGRKKDGINGDDYTNMEEINEWNKKFGNLRII